jgi:hypothetical protein
MLRPINRTTKFCDKCSSKKHDHRVNVTQIDYSAAGTYQRFEILGPHERTFSGGIWFRHYTFGSEVELDTLTDPRISGVHFQEEHFFHFLGECDTERGRKILEEALQPFADENRSHWRDLLAEEEREARFEQDCNQSFRRKTWGRF